MTTSTQLLHDGFSRVTGVAKAAVEDLTATELCWRAEAEANTIAWLIWHLARVQDDHVAALADRQQVWTAQGWADRFGLPFDDRATGYGQDSEEVALVAPESGALLLDYLEAVTAQTLQVLEQLEDTDLDRVVDPGWDPPVTAAVRLVSVLADDLQHAGQAALLRGLIVRNRSGSGAGGRSDT
ncbi:DUF664 domain-containing protein [soil metagenome]